MDTFWVTGATGRLGCEICSRLEQLNAQVVPLVLPGYLLQPKRVTWSAKTTPIAVENTDNLRHLPTPDYVLNLHWQVKRNLPFTSQLVYETDINLQHLTFLWEWLREQPLKRFVNLSSIKIFSHLNQNPIFSETAPRPLSPYGIVKVVAEHFFDAHFAYLPVTHLRLSAVASYGEHPAQLLSQMYASAFEGKTICLNTPHTTTLLYNELPRRKQRGIRIKIDSAGSLGAIVDIPFLAFLHI